MEEQLPHIQAATSSKRLVCSTLARIDNTSQEALLDSGSTISSISIDLVNSLNLPTSPAAQIQVVFGDKQQTYRSSTQAHCTFFLAQHKFLHSFYVLPRQLFPMTLGCDWFIKTGKQPHFDTQSLVLPSLKPFNTIPLFSSPQLSNHIMHTQVHLESTMVGTADSCGNSRHYSVRQRPRCKSICLSNTQSQQSQENQFGWLPDDDLPWIIKGSIKQ